MEVVAWDRWPTCCNELASLWWILLREGKTDRQVMIAIVARSNSDFGACDLIIHMNPTTLRRYLEQGLFCGGSVLGFWRMIQPCSKPKVVLGAASLWRAGHLVINMVDVPSEATRQLTRASICLFSNEISLNATGTMTKRYMPQWAMYTKSCLRKASCAWCTWCGRFEN